MLTDKELARLARGRHAQRLLDDETVRDALDYLADRATQEWRHSASANYDGREEAFRHVQALDALKGQLEAWASDAKALENKEAKAEARAQQPRRRFGVV